MINKDTSLFNFSKHITSDNIKLEIESIETKPVAVNKSYQVIGSIASTIVEEPITIVEAVLPKPIKKLSEDDVVSILDQFNVEADYSTETSNGVAYQDVQKVLGKIPTFVGNTQSSQVLNFSSDVNSLEQNTKTQPSDSNLFSVIETKPLVKIKVQSSEKKTIERSIIDGDVAGAFAGPNKTYPITCANDVKKVMKEAKTNNTASFKRVVNRAMSIGLKHGWLTENLSDKSEIETLSNLNNVMFLSDNTLINDKTEQQSITILNDNIPEFLAFEDTENNRMMLKIPAGRLGKWIHPDYGEIEFTQDKFDQAIDNFNAGVLGYEPTLNVGHWVEVQAFGSAPTEGIAVEVYQEEDVLYADYECLNTCLYNDVLNKKYRRSSSELVMDYVDRTNGREVGMTLVGMALTNRPFITDMPTVSVFSNKQSSHLIDNKPVTFAQFNLYENDNTNNDSVKLNNNILDNEVLNNSESMQTENTADTSATTPATVSVTPPSEDQIQSLSTEIRQVKVAFETSMKAQEQQFANQVAEYAKERESLLSHNATLESRIASMEAEKEGKLLADKVSLIKELDLSEEQKDSYIKMFTEKTFGNAENEKTVLNTLIKTFSSGTSFNKFTQQLGDTTTVINNGVNSQVNPYTALIERNKSNVAK